MAIGTKFYETIATNRKFAGNFTKPFLFRPLEISYYLIFNIFTLLVLCLVTFWNFKSFASSYIFHQHPTKVSQGLKRITNSRIAQRIDWLSQLTRLDQSWSIFAPNPPRDDGWHVITGTLKDGSKVNLLEKDKPVSWDKPTIEQRNNIYQNMQWRTYFINLNRAIGNKLYPYYSQYLCQQWNSEHKGKEQIDNLEIDFMSERTVPPGEEQTVEKQNHWQQSCANPQNDNNK
jgi:hypothetical protein